MNPTRRHLLRMSLGTSLLAGLSRRGAAGEDRRQGRTISNEELQRVAEAPVLQVNELSTPVTISGMELLRNRRNFLVRVRTRDGAENPPASAFVSGSVRSARSMRCWAAVTAFGAAAAM